MRRIQIVLITFGIFGFLALARAEQVCFEVQGMTCATCPLTVKAAVKKLKGIREVTASLQKNNAVVDFDSQKVNATEIKNAIDGVGYKAIPQVCNQNNKG